MVSFLGGLINQWYLVFGMFVAAYVSLLAVIGLYNAFVAEYNFRMYFRRAGENSGIWHSRLNGWGKVAA